MQIGAMNHPGRDPIEQIDWIGRSGFEFVDFTFEPPAAAPEQIDPKQVRRALDRHGLGVVAHTAYYLPISSPFSSIRAAALAEFRLALGAAQQIGATVMNTHFRRLPPFFSFAQAVNWHAETLTPLCDEAAELGITIVMEHVPHGGHDQLEQFVAILERVPLLRLHLDSGHAKLERSEDRWDEYLEQLGHKLLHVHLSDNDGTADQHLPLGSSPRSRTHWPSQVSRLKQSGYDGTITLEVFSPYREYLLMSRDLLRQWWDAA